MLDTHNPEYEAAVIAHLKAFNTGQNEWFAAKRRPETAPRPLELYLFSDNGAVVGGLVCTTLWDWLEIDNFWLDSSLRGKGLGTDLLMQVEETAKQRGCAHARLDTYSFQGRGFYEKMGYHVVGQYDDYPPGGNHYYMRKDFAI